jgi:DHA1 family bicyclomycin/chloramphenicol resistance-like MFS transporter
LFVVLKNMRFTVLLLIFSSASICFLAFVSASAFIYQNYFGLSEQAYSYFFAFNAAIMVVGPFLYIRLSSRFSRFALITVNFIIMSIAGLLICTVGRLSPWAFALSLLPSTMMGSFAGPPSRFLMLSQQTRDTGSAAALINAAGSIMGSVGMTVASLNFGNLVVVIGALNIILGVLCGCAWLFFTSRPFLRDVR